ncbi:hypothetical protein SAMN05518848_11220 [Paenibacillus sp. PDC88]|nr:hypothetical protein SAMN05518848_11220 [Paenibacillus sp. PDC88]SFS87994.1 hypothetical protein SAMN04488601_10616 [Paenibacillus sp. 453mf]
MVDFYNEINKNDYLKQYHHLESLIDKVIEPDEVKMFQQQSDILLRRISNCSSDAKEDIIVEIRLIKRRIKELSNRVTDS